jgi:ADP-ribose pyrophosphatase
MTEAEMNPPDGDERSIVFSGKRISVSLSRVGPLQSGWIHESVCFGEGVAILPIIDGKVFFVRQFRPSVSETVLELPAGKLENGEDPLKGAIRELKEETGIFGGELSLMGTIMTTPGFCDERIHLFLSTGGVLGESQPDEDEDLDIVSLPLSMIAKSIVNGSIRDGKTLSAFALYWSINKIDP